MPDPTRLPPASATPPPSPSCSSQRTTSSDAVICERCGAEMFRMHAVWRCPQCRY